MKDLLDSSDESLAHRGSLATSMNHSSLILRRTCASTCSGINNFRRNMKTTTYAGMLSCAAHACRSHHTMMLYIKLLSQRSKQNGKYRKVQKSSS